MSDPWTAERVVGGEEARALIAAGWPDTVRIDEAPRLGQFLRALHDLPIDGLPEDELRRVDVQARGDKTRAVAAELRRRDAIDDLVHAAILRAVDRAGSASARPRVFVHGDLYAQHLLIDDAGRLTGVIDWGDLHAGDPATDLGLALHLLPEPARAGFLGAYGAIDEPTWRLARFRAANHAVNTLRFALATGRDDLAAEMRAVLSRLPAE